MDMFYFLNIFVNLSESSLKMYYCNFLCAGFVIVSDLQDIIYWNTDDIIILIMKTCDCQETMSLVLSSEVYNVNSVL